MRSGILFLAVVVVARAQTAAPSTTASITISGINLQGVAVTPPGTAGTELHLSYSQQGAQALKQLTGSRIKGVGVYNVAACSPAGPAIAISSILVKQWAAPYGISWENATSISALLNSVAQSNGFQLALNATTDIPQIGTGLLASHVIASKSGVPGLILGGIDVVLGIAKVRFQARTPNVTQTAAAILPATINIPANGCVEGIALARYTGDRAPIELLCTTAGFCRQAQVQ